MGPREIEHEDVDSLIRALTDTAPGARAYRGHGDSTWRLEPSIVRNRRYQAQTRLSGLDTEHDSMHLENHFLLLFVNACDKAGLPVSGDSEKLRNFLDDPSLVDRDQRNVSSAQASQWPGDSNEMLSLMAQAQHYGVPTRLLDWTTAPLIAAYFAAAAALRRWDEGLYDVPLSRKLAIWELDIDASARYRSDFEIKRAPGSVSAHLPAQRGIFTLIKGRRVPNLCLEEQPEAAHFLTRHSLSVRDIPALMRECDRHGHSAATLFPDYEGAARHAEEIFLIHELSASTQQTQ